jgi:hypothetical protein
MTFKSLPSRRALLLATAGVLGGATWIASRTIRRSGTAPSSAFCNSTSAEKYTENQRSRIEHQRTDRAEFPIRVSEDRHYLVDAKGRPFLVVGDSAWSLLTQIDHEDADLYLKDRQAKGFNTLVVNLIEHKFSHHAPRNFDGDAPFLESGNFGSPNDRYFDYAASVLENAKSRGFLVFLAPAYGGFSGGDEGWYQDMVTCGEDKLREYGRFLGNRFRDLTNIIWVHGGDFNPPKKSLSRAVADGIREVWPQSLHTVHNAPETSGLQYWNDQEIPIIIDTLYTYQPVADKAAALASNKEKPFLLIESRYENERDGTPLRTRTQAWQAMLSGAAGQVFGNNPIWHFNAPAVEPRLMTWKSALNSPGTSGISALRDFFVSLPWYNLVPDNRNLIVGDPGEGHFRATAARTTDRRLAVIYLPTSRRFTVDPTQLSATQVKIRWFDPTDGTFFQTAEQTLDANGSYSLHTPQCSQEGDWVLMLTSVDW